MNSEPLQMPDGHVWYLHYDQETQLHTITIKTALGDVRARMTMTDDQLRGYAATPSELYTRAMEIIPEKIIEEPSNRQADHVYETFPQVIGLSPNSRTSKESCATPRPTSTPGPRPPTDQPTSH